MVEEDNIKKRLGDTELFMVTWRDGRRNDNIEDGWFGSILARGWRTDVVRYPYGRKRVFSIMI